MPYTKHSINPYSGNRTDGPREVWVRLLRLVVGGLAMFLVVWAYWGVQFRDAEGFLEGSFCLPLSIGITLMTLACAMNTSLNRFAFWFALALIGQATTLQMIQAGSMLRYQHYKPLNQLLFETHPLLLVFLLVQTAFVLFALAGHREKIYIWIKRTLNLWQFSAVVLAFILSSAIVSHQLSIYISELFFAGAVQAVNLGNIVLMVRAFPEDRLAALKGKFTKLLGSPGIEASSDWAGATWIPLAGALWVIILAASLNSLVYERHPHIGDEVAYLQHARHLANGTLSMPAPPVPEAFEFYLMSIES